QPSAKAVIVGAMFIVYPLPTIVPGRLSNVSLVKSKSRCRYNAPPLNSMGPDAGNSAFHVAVTVASVIKKPPCNDVNPVTISPLFSVVMVEISVTAVSDPIVVAFSSCIEVITDNNVNKNSLCLIFFILFYFLFFHLFFRLDLSQDKS